MKQLDAKTIRRFVEYSLLLFLIISAFTLVGAFYLQLGENSARNAKIAENEKNIVDLEAKNISKDLNSLFSDMRYLAYTFESNEKTNVDGTYQQLEENWKAFSDSKGIYYKIRYIDTNGEEKIRINYEKNGSYASKPEELENKKDRYYFKDSIALNKKQIYFSKLDLNVDNGEIELPIQPTIRLSMPVFGNDGKLKGIIVLSYNASFLIEDFRGSAFNSFGSIYLLNAEGYWLYNDSNKDKEWAFMYDEKASVSFKNEFPDEWKTMTRYAKGTIVTKRGIYTYKKILPFTENTNRSMAVQNEFMIPGDDNWRVVTFVQSDIKNGIVFDDDLSAIMLYSLRAQMPALLILFFVSMAFSALILANQRAKAKIVYFSFDTLTGVYNRRAGFALLEKTYHAAMKRGSELSLCFLDIDNLKEVNDNYGHEAGDALIVSVAEALKKNIAESDFIIRIGGDEFLIVFVNANPQKAELIWQQISREYERLNKTEQKQYVISVSHGIEAFKFDLDEFIDDIINRADEKMYNEKKNLGAQRHRTTTDIQELNVQAE